MPIAFKQAITPVVNTTTTSTVLSFAIAPGDVVVVGISTFSNQSLSISVTDDGGNHYNPGPLILPAGGVGALSLFAFASAPATAITVTLSAQPANSWVTGAVSYTAVKFGTIGNTGSVSNPTSTTRSITGNVSATTSWMIALLSCRSVTGNTATSGNLRAANTTTLSLALMDNTGALSLTCSITSPQSNVSSGLFLELLPAPVPSITTVTPNSGTQGTTVPVTISGSGFTNASAINITGTGVTVSGLTVVNDSTITANFVIASGASLGADSVSVTTPGGTSNTVIFTVTAPAIPTVTSISPLFGMLGTSVFVTITGTNFVAPATVQFTGTGVTASGVTVVNSTTITATVTIAANANIIGRTVSATTPGGTSSPPPFVVFGIHFTLPRNRAVIKYGFLKRKKVRERPKGPKRG